MLGRGSELQRTAPERSSTRTRLPSATAYDCDRASHAAEADHPAPSVRSTSPSVALHSRRLPMPSATIRVPSGLADTVSSASSRVSRHRGVPSGSKTRTSPSESPATRQPGASRAPRRTSRAIAGSSSSACQRPQGCPIHSRGHAGIPSVAGCRQARNSRSSCSRSRLRPMNTIRLRRDSSSSHGAPSSPSWSMCTPWNT